MQLVSMKSEYALLAMVYLAIHEGSLPVKKKSTTTVEEISKACGIPMNFLSKIMIHLNRAGLVRSVRGYNGGCALSRASDSIAVFDIVEAVEGSVRINRCSVITDACDSSDCCPFYSMWIEAQESLENVLKKYMLHSLAVCIKDLPEEVRFFDSLKRKFADNRKYCQRA